MLQTIEPPETTALNPTRFAIQRMMRIASKIRTGRRFTMRGLAKEFEVSEKTIQRDVEFMRDRLGYEMNYCRRNNGWYGMAPLPIL